MSNIFLETERLILRHLCEGDRENLYELDNDPEVMRYLNGGIATPWQIFEEEIFPGFLNYDPQYPGYGFWALDEKTPHRFIGWLSYRPTGADPLEVTLGFRIKRAFWGQGFAAEGAGAVLRKGFTEMGVHRVAATTYEKNLASRRVLEKIGMKLVRKFRISAEDLEKTGTFFAGALEIWDGYDLEYALTRSEWQGNHTG
jgi:RimJ/RimL family protein N-acetyltransferase